MGNSRSRHRPPPPSATTSTVQQQPHAPYPAAPPSSYLPQAPPYYPPTSPHGGQSSRYPQVPPQQQQQQQVPPRPAATKEVTRTATIRNAVNLKKASLRVAPAPNDPTKLLITFQFDASAPCCASTYVGAREEPGRGCRLTTAHQPPAPPVLFERGLGLSFPGGVAPVAVSSAHCVDLRRHSPEQLAVCGRDTYPLVVRLETVTEAGAREGHTLQERKPGDEQVAWVQSQTTFAVLHREDDGSWAVRVAKQKIWVGGVSYELQEIYGLEQSGLATSGSDRPAEDAEERLCVICLSNDRDTTVLPCRHMCMCHECAQELRKQTSRCPICRNQVESLLHIKMGAKAGAAQAAA